MILGFDTFSDQAKSVTIRDGLIIIVAMNVLAEDVASFVFNYQRRLCLISLIAKETNRPICSRDAPRQ